MYLEEGNYTLTWSEDDRTALRLIEVVFLNRSGRSPRKSNFSRAELRLGNRTSRDLRGFGTCFGARDWYRGFGISLARKTMQNGRKMREFGKWSRLPSQAFYRRLRPRIMLGVMLYAGRTPPKSSLLTYPKNSSARRVMLRCTLGVTRISPVTPLRIISDLIIKFIY